MGHAVADIESDHDTAWPNGPSTEEYEHVFLKKHAHARNPGNVVLSTRCRT